ncbi:hypothetical protein Hanom_Chr10g00879921 [Helianthus anomalus]
MKQASREQNLSEETARFSADDKFSKAKNFVEEAFRLTTNPKIGS